MAVKIIQLPVVAKAIMRVNVQLSVESILKISLIV